jgi:cellulose biosynthesis protein BcsQ
LLRTLLISASSGSANNLRYLADACGVFLVLKDFQSLPSSFELQRSFSLEPEIILLTTNDETAALPAQIRGLCPGALLIGVGSPVASPAAPVSCQLGHDAEPEDLLRALPAAIAGRLSASKCQLVSFMPAKAGSGCSTIALNIAACLARAHSKRVLLIDADLRSSVLTAMAGDMPDNGIEILFDQFDSLITVNLERNRIQWHGVDLLLSTRSIKGSPPSAAHYLRLLSAAAGRYDTIVTDLPELVNPATLAVVRASSDVFLVCTPELPALTLAQQRLSELDRIGLADDGVGIIVNRWHRTDPDRKGLAELLDHTRIHTFPNDYPAVRKSFAGHAPIGSSKLADAIKDFTENLLNPGDANKGIGAAIKNLFGFSRA